MSHDMLTSMTHLITTPLIVPASVAPPLVDHICPHGAARRLTAMFDAITRRIEPGKHRFFFFYLQPRSRTEIRRTGTSVWPLNLLTCPTQEQEQ